MPAQHVAAPAPAPATIPDCSVDGCDLPRHVTVSLQAVELAEKLNVKVNANDQPAGLCNRHNMQLHDSNRPTRFVCLAFLENRSLLLATAADFFTIQRLQQPVATVQPYFEAWRSSQSWVIWYQ